MYSIEETCQGDFCVGHFTASDLLFLLFCRIWNDVVLTSVCSFTELWAAVCFCLVVTTIITHTGILILHEDIMYYPSSKYTDTGTVWSQDESQSL